MLLVRPSSLIFESLNFPLHLLLLLVTELLLLLLLLLQLLVLFTLTAYRLVLPVSYPNFLFFERSLTCHKHVGTCFFFVRNLLKIDCLLLGDNLGDCVGREWLLTDSLFGLNSIRERVFGVAVSATLYGTVRCEKQKITGRISRVSQLKASLLESL